MVNAVNNSKEFSCHKISGGRAEAPCIISPDDICFYLCDPKTGIVLEEGHALKGRSLADKIVIFPSGKGSSVVQTDGLFQLAMNGNAPKAIIVQYPDTVLVASCIILDIPMVDRVDPAFYHWIESGVTLHLDADRERIRVMAP
ncbi:aconitase X swivel domain-containing protein [Sulfobacillus thermosulfidooxidans]|uniref:aconitase X swivel domain-containing protein n=1 Tax=Sulfobacillus thermosulfidooxidans TaxID=28034 RepID=UPI0006B4A0C9|nr:DUF126 domain-containing protein [Sulfobacillus thermosulfidooxidans]